MIYSGPREEKSRKVSSEECAHGTTFDRDGTGSIDYFECEDIIEFDRQLGDVQGRSVWRRRGEDEGEDKGEDKNHRSF